MKRLEIENLSFHYGQGGFQNQVLKNINFSMGDESVGLIGANGVGKSTLLKLLTGLLDIQEGSVRIASLEMNKGNLKKIRGEIGYVFQDSDSQLFMSTVYEDVAFGPRNYGKSEEETKRLVQKALEQVHMEGKSKRQIYRLSGGEKKLASIATVLAMEAGIMLLDEPSVALDPRNRRKLIQVLNELPKARIIASHDGAVVYDTGQSAVLLSDGEIAADGETEKVLTNQKLLEAHGLELPLSFWRRN